MSGRDHGDHRKLAAERFARFHQRPDVVDLLSRRADFVRSSAGLSIGLHLSTLAMIYIAGGFSSVAYRAAVREFAQTTDISLSDVLLMGQCFLELTRSALVRDGQIPFTPSVWDAQDQEGI